MRETTIEKYLKKSVEDIGGLCWKWSSYGQRGVPDRICIFPDSTIIFVEVKKPGEDLRPLQKKVKRMLEERGQTVLVVDSKEKVQELIKAWSSNRESIRR